MKCFSIEDIKPTTLKTVTYIWSVRYKYVFSEHKVVPVGTNWNCISIYVVFNGLVVWSRKYQSSAKEC